MRSSNENALVYISIWVILKCFSHFNGINEGFYGKQFDLIEHSVKISQGVGGQSECKWFNLISSSNENTTVVVYGQFGFKKVSFFFIFVFSIKYLQHFQCEYKMFSVFIVQNDTNELNLTLQAKTMIQTSKIWRKLAISSANVCILLIQSKLLLLITIILPSPINTKR